MNRHFVLGLLNSDHQFRISMPWVDMISNHQYRITVNLFRPILNYSERVNLLKLYLCTLSL